MSVVKSQPHHKDRRTIGWLDELCFPAALVILSGAWFRVWILLVTATAAFAKSPAD